MGLTQRQFGRLLDRDDPLDRRDLGGQSVEERGLAGAGAARQQKVPSRGDGPPQQPEAATGQPEVGEPVPSGREPADRHAGAVDGDRRQHRVEARTVGQPGVDHR